MSDMCTQFYHFKVFIQFTCLSRWSDLKLCFTRSKHATWNWFYATILFNVFFNWSHSFWLGIFPFFVSNSIPPFKWLTINVSTFVHSIKHILFCKNFTFLDKTFIWPNTCSNMHTSFCVAGWPFVRFLQ